MSTRHAVGGMAGAADHGTPPGQSLASPQRPDGSQMVRIGARDVHGDRTVEPALDELDELLAAARPVARGATSQVFRVRHPRLGCDVAIKVLDERHRDDPGLRARIEREARAVANLRDPGVLRVLDLRWLGDGRPAVVSEWLEGEDLEKRLRREGAIEQREALAIARDISLALAAAHERGVLHRDVKPSNVLLVDTARFGRSAVLLDFGVARCESEASETATGGLLGTPAYMAPEQARDASRVDARADVYATAALLFRMLSGEPPYEPGDPWTTLQRLATTSPRSLASLAPHVPRPVVDLVERGLSRDPNLRPASARSFAASLESVARLEDPQTSVVEVEQTLSPRRAMVSIAAATLVPVVTVTALASSLLAHPLRSEGVVLLCVLSGITLGSALTYLDRERQRSGGPRSALSRLERLSRTALAGFARWSSVALVAAACLAAFDIDSGLDSRTILALGFVGFAATLGRARRLEVRATSPKN